MSGTPGAATENAAPLWRARRSGPRGTDIKDNASVMEPIRDGREVTKNRKKALKRLERIPLPGREPAFPPGATVYDALQSQTRCQTDRARPWRHSRRRSCHWHAVNPRRISIDNLHADRHARLRYRNHQQTLGEGPSRGGRLGAAGRGFCRIRPRERLHTPRREKCGASAPWVNYAPVTASRPRRLLGRGSQLQKSVGAPPSPLRRFTNSESSSRMPRSIGGASKLPRIFFTRPFARVAVQTPPAFNHAS